MLVIELITAGPAHNYLYPVLHPTNSEPSGHHTAIYTAKVT